MNKYEKALDDLIQVDTSYIILRELVEQSTNGIYISKEKATELLEDLKKLKPIDVDCYDMAYDDAKDIAYNELYKALDWSEDNE